VVSISALGLGAGAGGGRKTKVGSLRNPTHPERLYRKSRVGTTSRRSICLPGAAIVNENSFAELLDRRLKRMEEMKLIEAKPTTNADKIIEGNPVDARLPPSIPDRRYRRF
jgi:hypothetical protein